MYGHILKLAEAEKAGIEAAGGTVDLYQYISPLPTLHSTPSLSWRALRIKLPLSYRISPTPHKNAK